MSATAVTLWWISLAIGLVVTIVAALLLTAILRSARAIDAGARQIWTTGKLVARNTVHVSALIRTNQIVADILEDAAAIQLAAQRIHAHAQGCPGCPACLVEGGRQRT